MSDVLTIQGAKAGNKQPKRPSIADDTIGSISRLKMVIGLTEGEAKGLANGAASIMLESTPLEDENGNSNFEGVEWDIRHGTVDQTYIAGMPNASTEIGIGTIVRSGTPWVRGISNTQLSSVNVNISFPMLKEQKDDGDVVGVTVDYVIEVQTDGNGYVPVVTKTLKAKTSGRYQRTHNVTLPDAQNNWQIRVRKLTEDGNNETLFNSMQVDSIAEVIDGKFNYPHTAHLYLSFDARTFSNIPKVSVDMLGVYVQVPINYDTETRTSTGLWNGQFKLGYTTNPAWHYYNLITNDRYGLGDKLQAFMIDKWALEHIARICDEPVDDGKGGTEPRFECNLYLQKAEDAYQVLQHIAGIFRGMSFWNGSKIIVDADTQRDCEYVITRANVIDGHFSKTGSAASDRHTIAKVAYSDPNNSYDTEYVMVRNERAIAQQGINVLDLSAVGCTSEGQAYRMGLAALLAEQNRTQTVSFSMGLDGSLPTVGSRIDIPDMMFTGANNSGRISSVSSNRRVITVDRDNVPATVGDKLMVNLDSGKAQSRVITAISGRAITVAIAFDAVAAENVWSVISDELPTMPFIVMSVVQNDDATQYDYTALQYDPMMYGQIDNGTIIEQRPPVPDNNPYIINAPDSVTITSRHRVVQGQNITTLVITWAQVKDAVAYDVEWRKDDGDWVKLPRTGNISAEVEGVYSGNYLARVKAVSAFDAVSKPKNSMLTNIKGKVGVPPAIVGLKATGVLFGMDLKWSFGAGSGDSDYTEIQVGSAPNVNVASLGQFSYPTNSHTINGLQGNLSQSYRARLVDKLGNKSVWSSWVTATTDASADKIMELIQGQIDESSLNASLTSKIGKIADNELAIGQETDDRIQAIIDTKQTADAAQQAATNAAELAGNKGEVIYQWQTPSVARRLPQNLWIDTTGGKNTPKRWDGSAWVVVTDKAATDALAAANEALSEANDANDSIITILDEQSQINNELGLQHETLQGVILDYKPRYTDKTQYTDASRSQNWTYWKTVSRDNYAANERITNLQSEVADSNAQLVKRIETEATATSALAREVTTLEATVGDNAASLQETKEVVDGIKGEYTLKLDVGNKVAGFGLVNNVGQPSAFDIRADMFSVSAPVGKPNDVNGTSPFMVLTNPQVIDGVTVPAGTYMRDFYAPKGSIDTLQVADGAITTAKIGSLQVDTAQIANGAIETAKIANLAVDTLQIKGQAVTVSGLYFAEQLDTFNIAKTESEIAGVDLNPEGGSVAVSFGFESLVVSDYGDRDGATLILRLKRDNEVLRTISFSAARAAGTSLYENRISRNYITFATLLDAPPTGNRRYAVTAQAADTDEDEITLKMKARSLMVSGAKK